MVKIPAPLPTTVAQICPFASVWGISIELATKLACMQMSFPVGLVIFSGARTEAEQDALRDAGNLTADNDRSTHLARPATGADVRPNIAMDDVVAHAFGLAAVNAGMRWGGGSPMNERGIPSDRFHLDLGRRP